MKKNILVVDKMHESLEEKFKRIGYRIDYCPDISADEALIKLTSTSYTGIIFRSKLKIDKSNIKFFKNLRFIGRAGAGIDNLDVRLIKEHKIKILNAPEGNRDSVAEHTIGMILSLMHNLMKSNLEVRNYVWNREGNRGIELKGKTVGILGYGNMGRALAERLHSFGCKVIAYDDLRVGFGSPIVNEVDFETFCEKTEILSIHIPLNKKNNRLINYKYLNKFKNLILLVNTSRGEVLVLEDLIKYMDERKWIGVGLDVLENEKLDRLNEHQKKAFENLRLRSNVIFSPHIAGWSHESYERINQVLADKVSKLDFAMRNE
jgi:D-3-phosphoglycerate dehydrogenase